MNKKQLSALLDQLAAKLEQAATDNKSLISANTKLREKCENLTNQLENAQNEIANLKVEIENLKTEKSNTSVSSPFEAEAESKKAEPPILSPIKNLERRVATQVRLSEETEYAASVIGKIVVSATEHCNYLTAQPNANAKELVNLILGKTEVLKAEILNIVYSETDFIAKKALIDNCFDTAKDYFASVKAQI